MLDISKAFDEVNHYCMFIKVMNHNACVVLLKMLSNRYDKCAVFVGCNNVLSRCFYLMRDVRQGGVLSPLLFSVYVNDMIQKLCDKSLGCYVCDVCCGCVMYADDLIPVSASVNLLQRMIDTCCVYLDMKFNALKSNTVRYDRNVLT